MRDLKHLYHLDKILLEANNELVREAAAEGRIAIGGVCAQIPEPLLNLPGAFQVRLRAPRTGSVEMGTYYMSSILCECCRAILERALEGGYQFLDCIVAPDACAQMNRCVENIEHLELGGREKFFVTYADVPMKSTGSALKHYVKQMQVHVLEPLRQRFGIDTGDEAIRKAVAVQNEVSRLIREMGEYRKEENPRITGYEFAVFCLATYCCPQDKLLPVLRETVEELKTRQPDSKPAFRTRVVLAGSEIDDPGMIRLIEEAGALVVADRYCLGSLPNRGEIALNDEEDALTQVCRTYIQWGQCPRFMNTEKIVERQTYVDNLVKEYRADGIVLQQLKFCDYWGYERAHLTHVMREEYGYPVLSVDRPYTVGNSGQLRTRVQAFVESIEIKKIASAKGEKLF